MTNDFSPIHSETVVVIGAGATAALRMPTTDSQTKIFRKLLDENIDLDVILSGYFKGKDLTNMKRFFDLLDGDGKNQFEVAQKDIENASSIYGDKSDSCLSNRILELRQKYDWNALRKILNVCPKQKNDADDNLVRDVYSIIDRKLLSNQAIKVCENGKEEVLPVSRLQGARNFLTLFINMLFAARWNDIANGEKADIFLKYKKLINTFDIMMRNEGRRFDNKYDKESRDFYLFTTSFVSFNFEMVFPWIFMNSHRWLNKENRTYFGDRPLQLWLDYGCEHRGRKTDKNGEIIPTLEFTESVASRQNESECPNNELHRCGKFYFAHGSANWRECPVCGRMTFYTGDSKSKWDYKSKELIPPFPIPLFGSERNAVLTQKELVWRNVELQYDALQCMHCGAKTEALDAPMIMQSMYKSTPTSFLEEIQRNVKVSLAKARHIVLLGYSLPIDDTTWLQALSEAVRSKKEKMWCSVVVGVDEDERWLYGDELSSFIKNNRNTNLHSSAVAIENAISIFGLKNVRAWTGGIPQVFGDCTEYDVKQLLYPDWVEWKGSRLEE